MVLEYHLIFLLSRVVQIAPKIKLCGVAYRLLVRSIRIETLWLLRRAFHSQRYIVLHYKNHESTFTLVVKSHISVVSGLRQGGRLRCTHILRLVLIYQISGKEFLTMSELTGKFCLRLTSCVSIENISVHWRVPNYSWVGASVDSHASILNNF